MNIQNIGKATEAISHINDKLIDSLMIELNSLRDKVNKGSNLSDVSSRLTELNRKLEELKKSYESTSVNNQENKRLILNQIDYISNSFFDSNLDPKIGEDNLEKIKFVELVNPEPILQQTGIFIQNIEADLKKLVRLINSHIELDKGKLVEYEASIKDKMDELGVINRRINETIAEIDRINNTYKDYIKQYDKIEFNLDNSYFFPNECLNESNPEMVTYSSINTSDEELNVDQEFQLLKESIQSINILNPIDKTTTIAKLMTDPNTLDKLLIGGSQEQQEPQVPQVQRTQSYGVQSHENYYQHVLDYSIKLEEIQRNFSSFKNKCRSFNIKYIRMYNHVLFIVNYLKLTVLDQNKDYQIYNYIGLNTLIYYKEIIDKIIESIDKKTTLGKYFNKYHYINIEILKKFFNFVLPKWQIYGTYCENFKRENDSTPVPVKKATSKLHLYNDKLLDNHSIKKSVFIFNAMKDLLDKFKSLSSPQVAVYLRINHNPNIGLEESEKVFVKDNVNIGYISNKSLSNCTFQSQVRQKYDIGNVKFAEVFDSETFNDNSVLSKYMSIPTFLSQGKSIMLLTYGYSGVGKTFTVFGTKEKPGMLQTAIGSIQKQHQHGIYFRAYELYGLAFPYKSYWAREPDKYHQFIYDYTKTQSSPDEITSSNIKRFVNQIDKDPTIEGTSFKVLTHDQLQNFQKIINDIDSTRESKGRIKKTKNNVKSSRSIMIFDFKIKIKETGKYVEDYVNFVIIDLPGKENIKETFVDGDICIPLKDSTKPDIRNKAFLSPLSLMLDDNIATKFVEKFNNLSQDKDFSITYLGDDYKNHDSNYNHNLDKIIKKGDGNYGLEIMRNIITNNKFDLLSEFYEEYLFKPPNDGCYKNKGYSLAPFEGYYINENIIGLLSSLLKNLCLNNKVIEVQDEIFSNTAKIHVEFISNANKTGRSGNSYIHNINTEVKAQTYFFRFLLKMGDINLKTEFCGHTVEDWINNSYDYNKIFNVDNPPIEGLLEPYFKYIENFYVFYVVSNDNFSKCDKQIKLIADSKIFLDELNRWNEDNNKKNSEGNCINK